MNNNQNNTGNAAFEIDLFELFGELFRKKFLIIFVTVVCGVIGFAYSSFLATPLYRSSAMLIVNSGDRTDYVTSDQLRSASSLVSTYSVIIRSATVMDEVKENLGMTETYDSVVTGLTVTAVDDTQIMRISVTAKDPQIAYEVCNEITKVSPKIIVKTVKAGSAEVVAKAVLNEDPVSPSIKRNTAIAAVVGLLISAAYVLLRTMLDTKIKGEADLKMADLAILGVIPYYDTEA